MASSFPSFPSFNSFPDLDAAEPNSKSKSSGGKDATHRSEEKKDRDHKKRSARRKDKGDRDSKERKRKRERRGREDEGEPGSEEEKDEDEDEESTAWRARRRRRVERGAGYGGTDDERLKAADDARLSRSRELVAGYEATVLPLYITDRKGDALILRYGSLHAGDIPRYHIVGCECVLETISCILLDA